MPTFCPEEAQLKYAILAMLEALINPPYQRSCYDEQRGMGGSHLGLSSTGDSIAPALG